MKIAEKCVNAIPPYPHIDGKNITYPCYAEVKLDGEANIYYKGQLVSKASGKVRYDCPITNTLSKIVDDKTILFGELHWGDGQSGALYDFLSHAKDDGLNFTIFDVYNPVLENKSYEVRREWLIENILSNAVWKAQAWGQGSVRITRPMYIEDQATLDKIIKTNADEGWEGVVVKHPDSLLFSSSSGLIASQTRWVKLKHKTTGDYEVMGISTTQERMDVWVGDKNTGRTCGVKLVNKYKPFVKVGNMVEIEHQGVLAQGGLRHPVYRGKVTVF